MKLRAWYRVALVLLAVAVLGGCATETRIRPKGTVPDPAWVQQPPEHDKCSRYYVGIALVDNILEEKQARQYAIQDAAEQVARNCAMGVTNRTSRFEVRKGPAQFGKDRVWDELHDRAKVRSETIVTKLTPMEYYYEQWFMRERFLAPAFTRYKYFVLCRMPQKEFHALCGTTALKDFTSCR